MVAGTLVVAFAIFGFSQALDMSMVEPYNLTAAVMFLSEDLNQDGVMTVQEIEAVFDKYDANGDGRESRQEYTTFVCASSPNLYQLSHYLYDDYDINGDHHLEKDDYDGFFAKMDVNSDGQVLQEEFVDYWVALFTKYETMGNHQHGQSHEHGSPNCA